MMGKTTTPRKDRIRRRAGEDLIQISWDSNGNPVSLPSTQQQAPPKGAILVQQQDKVAMMDPSMQLAMSQATAVWSYTVFLGVGLGFWMLYLLLPRGFRKQYCQATRKRYTRRTDKRMPAGGYWLPANRSMDTFSDATLDNANQASPPSTTANSPPRTPPRDVNANRPRPPSPEHPALMKIPPNRIIAETMGRLQERGIRLIAHGVHCDPKRVWIKLEDDTASVTWQTEFPRRVPDQSGQVSIVLMRGSIHRISLCNVLYIDVGRKTNALQRLDITKAPDTACFSLLTQNGSLDLQANSKLERDALVSCFSMVLDDVHDEDWRAIYEASPPPSSVATESRNGVGSEVVHQPDLLLEI